MFLMRNTFLQQMDNKASTLHTNVSFAYTPPDCCLPCGTPLTFRERRQGILFEQHIERMQYRYHHVIGNPIRTSQADEVAPKFREAVLFFRDTSQG